MLVNPFMFSSSPPPPALEFREVRTDNTQTTSKTFTAMDIGAASADRLVIVSITCSTSFTTAARWPTGVTIGGVTATQIAEYHDTATSGGSASIWCANVPSGTTADVVLTNSGGFLNYNRFSVATYRAVGLASFTPDSFGGQTGSPASASISYSNMGVVIGVAHRSATASNNGLTGVDLDATNISAGTSHTASHGSKQFVSSGSVNVSGTSKVAAASWHFP